MFRLSKFVNSTSPNYGAEARLSILKCKILSWQNVARGVGCLGLDDRDHVASDFDVNGTRAKIEGDDPTGATSEMLGNDRNP